jgi:hypothetical protein
MFLLFIWNGFEYRASISSKFGTDRNHPKYNSGIDDRANKYNWQVLHSRNKGF